MALAFCLPAGSSAQTTVEVGTESNTSRSVPYDSYWGYSLVEQIYTATEIGKPAGGRIISIGFNLSSSDIQTNHIVVYMKNVSRSSFTSSSDYELLSETDIVFDGDWSVSQGWNTIGLETPFLYDGTSSLLIAFHENTPGYSQVYFYCTEAPNTVLSYHSDTHDINPLNPTQSNPHYNLSAYRANLKLLFDDGPCYAPTGLTTTGIQDTFATLGWTAGDGESQWDIHYKAQTSGNGYEVIAGVTDNPYTLTGLDATTTYQWYVVARCDGGQTSIPSLTDSFTTPCQIIS